MALGEKIKNDEDLDSNLDIKFNKELAEPEPYTKYGVRHIQTILLFFMLVISYALRVNISMGVVAMVDNTENKEFEQFDWDSSTKSVILSSFFWGYVVAQLPAGPLARRYGSKILLLVGIGVGSIANLLVPLGATVGGWETVVALRIIYGISQGFVNPCTHALIVKWAPIRERGKFTTFIYAGSQLGNVIMLATSGLLVVSSTGWPGIFYISGAIGCLWTVLWFFFGANEPKDYKNISPEERKYIEYSCGSDDKDEQPPSIPWKGILTCVPFWALLIVHCGNNWGQWTLFTNIPNYMKNVLDYDIKENALLSALPYLVMWLLSFVFSFAADYVNNRKLVTPGTSRKIFNSIGHWVPMVMLIGLGFVTKDEQFVAVLLLTICVGVNAGQYVGYLLNHMDLSPNFAGTLMGLTNFAANGVSILAPLIVGVVIENESDPLQWRIVFFISAAIYFVGNLIFVIFGRGTIQSWNNL